MKKWHMEGIIDKANNQPTKVVFRQGDQIYFCAGNYLLENRRKPSLLGCFRIFSTFTSRKKLLFR